MKEKVLVLAGGYDQIFLIEEIKRRGFFVILADYLDNPPAKEYADKFFQVSTLDEDAIYAIAINEEVCLITTACTDQALLTMARVSERIGLSCYISADTAQKVTDKVFMKRVFGENDIPTAKCCFVEDLSNYYIPDELVREFPLVVKPCDCNSAKGIKKVYEISSLEKAIEEAFTISRSHKVVIEKFIQGDEITIDVWKDNEGSKVISVSEIVKTPQNREHFTIFQNRYPYVGTDSVYRQISEIAEKITTAFGLENCPVLIQALVDDEKNVFVEEFSARMGGGSKPRLIEYMTDFDIMRKYVDRVLGDTSPIECPFMVERCFEIDYLYAENGVYDRVIGFDELMKAGEILEVFMYKKGGTVIQQRVTSSDRIAGILLGAETVEELEAKRKRVLEKIDIIDEQGRSIFYRKYFS